MVFARAAVRRAAAQVRRVLEREPGEAHDVELVGAQSIARSAGAMKGGVAKVAQLMAYLEAPSAMTDVAARAALGALWDRAPADDRAAVRQVIVDDLGAPPESLFAAWDDTPLAAASLGQVHAATGKDGVALAVKVQYPGVAAALDEDLGSRALVRRLAGEGIAEGLSPAASAALVASVRGELDYRAEAVALERFRAAWSSDLTIVVPRVFPSLSSGRVLTMERLSGRPPHALDGAPDEVRARVALAIFRFHFGSPLRHGLVNADPNPGNYLILDEDGARVGFLDFGCTLALDEELLAAERDLWRAILKGDGETLRHAVYREGLLGSAKTLDRSTFRAWEALLAAPFLLEEPFLWTPQKARALITRTSELLRDGGLRLPPQALLLWRARLGAISVIASLRARVDYRSALKDLLKPPAREA